MQPKEPPEKPKTSDEEAHELAEALAAQVMEPLLLQLETLTGDALGELSDADKITMMAVAKANATSYAIVKRVLQAGGLPPGVDAMAMAAAKQTAERYMRQVTAEREAWLKARSN